MMNVIIVKKKLCGLRPITNTKHTVIITLLSYTQQKNNENGIKQCLTILFSIVSPDLGSTVLFNIANVTAHNIFQYCYHQS